MVEIDTCGRIFNGTLITVSSKIIAFTCLAGQPHLDPEHHLMHDLFLNYSKEVRPVIDKGKPITVNFDMMFSQLVELVSTLRQIRLASVLPCNSECLIAEQAKINLFNYRPVFQRYK